MKVKESIELLSSLNQEQEIRYDITRPGHTGTVERRYRREAYEIE
jgi:hypothetical protein